MPPCQSRVDQTLVSLQLALASLLKSIASHVRPSRHMGRAARQLLPPLFHGATGRVFLCTHPAQGALYVHCSLLGHFASGLELELVQWSSVKQTLPIVLV